MRCRDNNEVNSAALIGSPQTELIHEGSFSFMLLTQNARNNNIWCVA